MVKIEKENFEKIKKYLKDYDKMLEAEIQSILSNSDIDFEERIKQCDVINSIRSDVIVMLDSF